MDFETLKKQSLLIDTCALLAGQDCKTICFDEIKKYFLEPLFNGCEKILIHEAVLSELNLCLKWSRDVDYFLKSKIGTKVKIVSEKDLYGTDPKYTDIFSRISACDVFGYRRTSIDLLHCPTKDRGEIASLAYAEYYEIPFFVSVDEGAFLAVEDLQSLFNVKVHGVELGVALGYLSDSSQRAKEILRIIYRVYGNPGILRGRIPKSMNVFLEQQGIIKQYK